MNKFLLSLAVLPLLVTVSYAQRQTIESNIFERKLP